MKTIVMGSKIKNTYEVKIEKDENGKFISKPEMELVDEDVKWEEILSYDAEPQGNGKVGLFDNDYYVFKEIYISEDEKVRANEAYFRADICAWIQKTDKVLEEKDNKKKLEKELAAAIAEYNTQKIEDNPKAKAYCDLHKLNYAETDYEELMEVIKPEKIGTTEKGIYVTSSTAAELNDIINRSLYKTLCCDDTF